MQLTELLLNNNNVADAKKLADKITAAAETPAEKLMAQHTAELVAEHQESGNSAVPGAVIFRRNADANTAATATANSPGSAMQRMGIGVEGVLTYVHCDQRPEITLDLILDGGNVSYHIADVAKLTLTAAANGTPPACTAWSGRKVMLWFTPPANPQAPAEVSKIAFELFYQPGAELPATTCTRLCPTQHFFDGGWTRTISCRTTAGLRRDPLRCPRQDLL